MDPKLFYKNLTVAGAEIAPDDMLNDTRPTLASASLQKVSIVHHDDAAGVCEITFENGMRRYVALTQGIEVLKFIRPSA